MSMRPHLFASAERPGDGLGICPSSGYWSCHTYCPIPLYSCPIFCWPPNFT